MRERIKEMRVRAGLTQEKLSQELGVTQSAVAKWETGESSPLSEKLPDLARVLGCTIGELFDEPKGGERI